MTKVYAVKYCLTDKKIEEYEAETVTETVVLVKTENGSRLGFWLGKDAFFDREQAVARAEVMRLRKIASLKKQIARLEQLKFE